MTGKAPKWSYLIESDSSARNALRTLLANPEDIVAWYRAWIAAKNSGQVLRLTYNRMRYTKEPTRSGGTRRNTTSARRTVYVQTVHQPKERLGLAPVDYPWPFSFVPPLEVRHSTMLKNILKGGSITIELAPIPRRVERNDD